MLYESMESIEVKKTGVMPLPKPKREELKGGHAVLAVGYDDRRNAVLARNSWGPDWGIGGYFWMPYKFISNPEFTHSFWTIRGVTG
jgi:C1A family cysteine protease